MSQPQVLEFDIVFHLFGEQAIPNFMAIKLCRATPHVPVVTAKTVNLIDRVKAALGPGHDPLPFLEVDPYDIGALRTRLEDGAAKAKGMRIGFNLTGGTKPMFAAALDVCRRCDGTAFYIDTHRRTIDFLEPNRPAIPLPPAFSSVEEFVRLAGYGIKQPGRWEDAAGRDSRVELTKACWRQRSLIGKFQRQLAAFNERPGAAFKIGGGEKEKTRFSASLREGSTADLSMGGKTFSIPDFPDFARYLSGGWLEEFCFISLLPLVEKGEILDLRIGMMPSWGGGDDKRAQEFDVAFTDGYGLTVIECKAGSVNQEAVQKLENLTRMFGGVFGKGILASSFPLYGSIPSRISSSPNCAAIVGHAGESIMSHALSIQPGKIVGSGQKGRRSKKRHR